MFYYINFPSWLRPEIIKDFPVRWYGLMYIVAFAVAYYLFKYQIKEEKGYLSQNDKDDISNFFVWGIAGLIIGARLLSTLLYDGTWLYYKKPWLIFWPFKHFRFAPASHIFKGPIFFVSIIVLLVSVVYLIYRQQVQAMEKNKKKGKKSPASENNGEKKEDSIYFILFLLILASGILLFTRLFTFEFIGLQGMSYHGGVIGCAVGAYLYCRKYKKSYLLLGDYATASIPLGYTFGRLGNFINGELFGRVTAAPWGMIFPGGKIAASDPSAVAVASKLGMDISGQLMVNLPRHPSQLYEAFFEGIVLWAVIWFLFRKRKPFNGFIIGIYIMGYGIIRFIIEFFRQPDMNMGKSGFLFWHLTTGQLLCFFMIVGGLVLLFLFSRYNKKQEAEGPSAEPVENKKNTDFRKLRKKIK